MCALAYTILFIRLVRIHPKDSVLARAMGKNYKGKVSILCYVVAIVLAFFDSRISTAL